MSLGEVACTYATLILHDDGIPITSEKIATLVKAANVDVESYWPSLFAKLAEKRNVEDLIMNVGSGGGAAPVAAAAPTGGATAAAAAPAAEEKKGSVPMAPRRTNKEESYEPDDEMTDEQRELYYKMVNESQGFDVPDFPPIEIGQITQLDNLKFSHLRFSCKLAIDQYKEKEGKMLKLVEILKANVQVSCMYCFYITFLAEDTQSGKVGVYQAKFYCSIPKENAWVDIMRLKPQPGCTTSNESAV